MVTAGRSAPFSPPFHCCTRSFVDSAFNLPSIRRGMVLLLLCTGDTGWKFDTLLVYFYCSLYAGLRDIARRNKATPQSRSNPLKHLGGGFHPRLYCSFPIDVGSSPVACIRDHTNPLNPISSYEAHIGRILNLQAISFNRSQLRSAFRVLSRKASSRFRFALEIGDRRRPSVAPEYFQSCCLANAKFQYFSP